MKTGGTQGKGYKKRGGENRWLRASNRRAINIRAISRLSRRLLRQIHISRARSPPRRLLLFATDIERGKGSSEPRRRGVVGPTSYLCHTPKFDSTVCWRYLITDIRLLPFYLRFEMMRSINVVGDCIISVTLIVVIDQSWRFLRAKSKGSLLEASIMSFVTSFSSLPPSFFLSLLVVHNIDNIMHSSVRPVACLNAWS